MRPHERWLNQAWDDLQFARLGLEEGFHVDPWQGKVERRPGWAQDRVEERGLNGVMMMVEFGSELGSRRGKGKAMP